MNNNRGYDYSEVDGWFRENWPKMSNREVASRLGIAERTVSRHAHILGLKKDREYIADLQHKLSRLGVEASRGSKHPWLKKYWAQPGQSNAEKFGKDKEAERLRKSREGLKKVYEEERMRMRWGLPTKTKYRLNMEPAKKERQRHYLAQHGYVIDREKCMAYWTENTTRAAKIEATTKFFRFAPLPENKISI